MNLVKSIHETAMQYSTLAGISLAKGDKDESLESYQLAFELEKKAAFKARPTEADPFSRLILLRSAAALAIKSHQPDEGERLVKIALSENPPTWLKNELLELQSQIDKGKKGGETPFVINGVVTQANASEKAITVENEQQSWSVLVLNNQLDDIVANFWKKTVRILAKKSPQGTIVLENIGFNA